MVGDIDTGPPRPGQDTAEVEDIRTRAAAHVERRARSLHPGSQNTLDESRRGEPCCDTARRTGAGGTPGAGLRASRKLAVQPRWPYVRVPSIGLLQDRGVYPPVGSRAGKSPIALRHPAIARAACRFDCAAERIGEGRDARRPDRASRSPSFSIHSRLPGNVCHHDRQARRQSFDQRYRGAIANRNSSGRCPRMVVTRVTLIWEMRPAR